MKKLGFKGLRLYLNLYLSFFFFLSNVYIYRFADFRFIFRPTYFYFFTPFSVVRRWSFLC